ncbi:MAG: adenylate/guanylate cyclase domain-containing protein [Chloroflexi bacterium]|nr:adenylate/guanylate cyclase domain-containing protein [Chloroflexota bacterium]
MQYAQTADGVRIAYAVAGHGQPLVRVPSAPFSHCQVEWRQGDFYDRLCQNRSVVTFDPRGTGLSDREAADYSLDARLLDLEAVVDRLGLETFALNAIWYSGPLVIAYAVRHAERVTHLVLDDTFADAGAVARNPISRALRELESDWEALTESIAFTFAGAGGDEALRYAEFLRSCTTQDAAIRMRAADARVDVTDLLPDVQAPALILQHAGIRGSMDEHARQMAALIPDAQLVVLDGKFTENLDHLLSAMTEFLGDEASPPEATPGTSAFRTVLFTDLVGHTEMMSRLGDERGREVLREHETITRDVLKQHAGTEVKTMGDGFMASFPSATKALECAIATQRAFAEHNESAEEPIQVRIGLNAGEPIAEEDDLFGTAVITAARICAKAEGGEILTSDTVRQIVAGKDFLFSDRGDVALRGFEDPVRLYEVRWREEG